MTHVGDHDEGLSRNDSHAAGTAREVDEEPVMADNVARVDMMLVSQEKSRTGGEQAGAA